MLKCIECEIKRDTIFPMSFKYFIVNEADALVILFFYPFPWSLDLGRNVLLKSDL